MSTQVDSLSIKIESTSQNASKAIDNLITSLSGLQKVSSLASVQKQIAKFATAVEHLNSAAAGTRSIDGMVKTLNSLSTISAAKGLNSTLNSMRKLPQMMQMMQSFDAGDASRIQSFASALAPLGNIGKATGLNSMLNAVKKLPEAFAGIDDTVLSDIAKKANTLVTALSPLSKQIEKLTVNAKKLPTGFTAAARSADQMTKSVNTVTASTRGLGTAMSGTLATLRDFVIHTAGIYTLGQGLATALSAAREWDGISARFAEGFGDQVNEAYAHVQKLSEALYINDQVFMQYASNFATLARGFGVTESAIKGMSLGLTELAYDIYAKNNDFYTFTEAMDAVRSAIVGEVEPIRRAGISITEATLKEVAANNGIAMSVENMTEAQKAMLRYKAMVDQAYASSTVGTYIQELNTVEGSSRALGQQLKGLAQTIGAVLMPVIAAVMPYIQAFVALVTMAIRAIGSLFGISVKSPSWSSGMDSLSASAGGAKEAVDGTTDALKGAGGAAKKLRDYVMGFDELNVIKPQDNSGGGGGGGGGGIGDLGLDLDSLWTDAMIEAANLKAEEIVQNILKFLQPLKDAIQAIDFQPLVDSAKRLGEALKPFAATIGLGLYWFLVNVLVPLAGYTIENIIPAFLNGLAAALEWATPQLQQFGAWLVANKEHIATVAVYAAAFFGAFKLVSWVTAALPAIKTFLGTLGGVGSIIGIVKSAIATLLVNIQALIIAFSAGGGGLGGTLAVIKVLFSSLGSVVLTVLKTVFSPFTAAVVIVASTAMVLAANWDKVVQTFKNFIENINLAGKFEAVKTALAPLVEKLAGMQDLFTVIGTIGAAVLAIAMGVVAGAFNMVVSMIAPLIDAIGGVIDILAGLGSFIVAVFTGDWNKAWESIKLIWDGIVGLFGGLWDAVVAGVTGFVEGVIGWFTSLWDTLVGNSIVPDTINSIITWFLSLPGAILDTISQFVADVIAFFSTLWTDIKKTWQGVSAWFGTLFTTAWTNIKTAWKSVGTWFSTTWTTVTNVFKAAPGWFKTQFTTAWTNIKNVFSGWGTYFSNLWNTISTTFSKLGTSIGDAVGGAVKSGINSILKWVQDTVNKAINLINGAIDIINKVPGVNVDKIKTVSIPMLASGGYVGEGQMFIAREAGPELVGTMNGHTAVANNDQIVEGISQGVYAAVLAAMSQGSNNNTANVNVYLDGKQITAAVEKRQRERGATIMTGGVTFGY